jgi:Stigma-specific protein, Stig1
MRRSAPMLMALVLVLCAGCLQLVDFTPQCDGTVCGGKCVNVDSDQNNCGECGQACFADEACQQGACVCLNSNLTLCGSICVNLKRDPYNCGACYRDCGGASCKNGECVCSSSATICDGGCVDTATDVDNCGQCGHGCLGGFQCVNGSCVAPCQGTPTPCASRTTNDCDVGAGCKVEQACLGGSFSCADFNHACVFCDGTPGCSCDSNGDCQGGLQQCTAQSIFTCNTTVGCTQGSACRGTATPCEQLSGADCTAQPGCSLTVSSP